MSTIMKYIFFLKICTGITGYILHNDFLKENFKTCSFTAGLTNKLEVILQSSLVFSIFLECW